MVSPLNGKKTSFKYTSSELNLLACFQDQSNLFSLVSKDWTLIGWQPKRILTTWQQVKKWYEKKSKGCLIGYIGYEQGYHFVNPLPNSCLLKTKKTGLKLPGVYFGWFQNYLLFNKKQQRLYIVYKNKSFLNTVKKILKQKIDINNAKNSINLKSNITKTTYNKLFNKVLNHIKVGDIYQANLSHVLSGSLTDSEFNLFKNIYKKQSNEYNAFIKTNKFSIISNSPELFLKVQKGIAETYPMKGTIPRGKTKLQDKKLKQKLLNSKKDKAELDMITDMHRNDLYKTSKTGGVTVVKRRQLIPLTTVWQAIAKVEAKIDKKYTTLDVIENLFPAGSITGAPKIRAMEIIHQLESTRRNAYTGCIGYLCSNGETELNVAIRTAIVKNKKLYYNVGGGIVFDSTKQAEYQETLDKAKVLFE